MKGHKIIKSNSYLILYLNCKIEVHSTINHRKEMVPNGQSMLDLRYSVRLYAKVFRSYLLMRTYISNALHPALVITQKRHILK